MNNILSENKFYNTKIDFDLEFDFAMCHGSYCC